MLTKDELKLAALDRLAICPDHRGKAMGERCYVCKAEESARREARAEFSERQQSLLRYVETLLRQQETLAVDDDLMARAVDPLRLRDKYDHGAFLLGLVEVQVRRFIGLPVEAW